MFKGLGNLTGMMQQAREMQERMAAARDRIGALRVEGSAGGGMVTVQATGDMRIQTVKLDPTLLAATEQHPPDRELIEDLIASAVNQALQKAKDESAAEMARITGSLDVPGLQDALSKMGLGDQSST